ncbi:MAG: hypothetical protein WBP47_08205, partial [Candidatus Promineifilaceae bacterium]
MGKAHQFFLLVCLLVGLAACGSAPDVAATAVPPALTPTATPPPPTPVPTHTSTPVPTLTPTPEPTRFAPPDIHYLQAAVEAALADFDGLSSYVIIDLTTGDQISHDPDLAIAGMSLIKIPLLVETFRALTNPPDVEQTKLLTQTTSLSSNFAAN